MHFGEMIKLVKILNFENYPSPVVKFPFTSDDVDVRKG